MTKKLAIIINFHDRLNLELTIPRLEHSSSPLSPLTWLHVTALWSVNIPYELSAAISTTEDGSMPKLSATIGGLWMRWTINRAYKYAILIAKIQKHLWLTHSGPKLEVNVTLTMLSTPSFRHSTLPSEYVIATSSMTCIVSSAVFTTVIEASTGMLAD